MLQKLRGIRGSQEIKETQNAESHSPKTPFRRPRCLGIEHRDHEIDVNSRICGVCVHGVIVIRVHPGGKFNTRQDRKYVMSLVLKGRGEYFPHIDVNNFQWRGQQRATF